MHQIYHNLKIFGTPSTVFEAIISPDLINKWWTEKCSGEPVLGNEYMFWFAPEYDWRARITKLIKNEKVTYTMIKADEDWMDTKLIFRMEETETGTLLHFYHNGWKLQNKHFGMTSFCWVGYLSTLKELVEK